MKEHRASGISRTNTSHGVMGDLLLDRMLPLSTVCWLAEDEKMGRRANARTEQRDHSHIMQAANLSYS